MRVNLSEKGGWPNTIRTFAGSMFFISAGACWMADHIVWAVALTAIGAGLTSLNVAHNFLDNYGIGHQDGFKKGSLARGLISPEADMPESRYRVLVMAPFDGAWLVAVQDLDAAREKPRVYRMEDYPPICFRRIRLKDPASDDPDAFVPGYEKIQEPA